MAYLIKLALVSVFILFFANNFTFRLACLYYPLYELHRIVYKKNYQRKIRSISKYLIIYGCLDFIIFLLDIFDIHFYRLCIFFMFFLFQINKYKPDWIS